jgi:hypothetical protein
MSACILLLTSTKTVSFFSLDTFIFPAILSKAFHVLKRLTMHTVFSGSQNVRYHGTITFTLITFPVGLLLLSELDWGDGGLECDGTIMERSILQDTWRQLAVGMVKKTNTPKSLQFASVWDLCHDQIAGNIPEELLLQKSLTLTNIMASPIPLTSCEFMHLPPE